MGEKKLYIQTLGCAMNERDSAHIVAELAQKEHYTLTANPQDADLIIINTCSVREKPERKLFSEIGALARGKKSGAKIGICGCTASHLGESIIKKAPSVDFVLGALKCFTRQKPLRWILTTMIALMCLLHLKQWESKRI